MVHSPPPPIRANSSPIPLQPPLPLQMILLTPSKPQKLTEKKEGNVLRVHPGSRMTTGTPQHATSAKAMAMRWSSYVSISTLGLTYRAVVRSMAIASRSASR